MTWMIRMIRMAGAMVFLTSDLRPLAFTTSELRLPTPGFSRGFALEAVKKISWKECICQP